MTSLPQNYSLENTNILVTGATGYLGQAMVRGLAELGATVLVNGRSQEKVDKLVNDLRLSHFDALPAVFDINDKQAVERWFSEYGAQPLHGLVNNAYAGGSGSLEAAQESDYRHSYEVTVVAAQRLLCCALPGLRAAVAETGYAAVVNIASMYGMVSPDQRVYASKAAANPPFYGAAKAALLQWTRYAACEFGHEGIRVNAISPGPFPSETVQRSAPEFVSTLAGKVPMGRVGRANELQGPLSFLISGASSYVNGANLVVDGGWTCW